MTNNIVALNSGNNLNSPQNKIKSFLITFGIIAITIASAVVWFFMSIFMEPNVETLPSWHPFNSIASRLMYQKYYNYRLESWPVKKESRFVNTSYGKTHVLISGPNDAPPLILLPPVSSSALSWRPNIKTLSDHFRVYAVDNIYDFGLSIYTRTTRKPEDCTNWMDELFTGLGLKDKINIAGFSLGGWYTSQYALRFPNRLNKIILLAPAGTVMQIPFGFVWRAFLCLIPIRYFMESMTRWSFPILAEKDDPESKKLFDEGVDDAIMGLNCFKFKMPVEPTVLSDIELKRIQTPALFLVGEKEVIYSAKEAVNRLNKAAPQIKTEIIPNASHDLPYVQAELVNSKIIDFILK